MRRTTTLVLLAFCLTGRQQLTGQSSPVASVGIPVESSESILRPGDVVRISVWPAAELGGDFPIEASGLVYLPMLGEFRAAGVPLDALRSDLRSRLGEAMKTPVVTVIPLFKVSVLGEVIAPGLYPVESNQTILDVVSMAGGFTREANRSSITLIRGERTYEIDTESALASGGGVLNLPLHSGDRVLIPSRRSMTFSNVMALLQTTVALLTLYNVVSR